MAGGTEGLLGKYTESVSEREHSRITHWIFGS